MPGYMWCDQCGYRIDGDLYRNIEGRNICDRCKPILFPRIFWAVTLVLVAIMIWWR